MIVAHTISYNLVNVKVIFLEQRVLFILSLVHVFGSIHDMYLLNISFKSGLYRTFRTDITLWRCIMKKKSV